MVRGGGYGGCSSSASASASSSTNVSSTANPCGGSARIVDSDGEDSSPDPPLNASALVGVVVGGLFALLFLVGIAVFALGASRRKRQEARLDMLMRTASVSGAAIGTYDDPSASMPGGSSSGGSGSGMTATNPMYEMTVGTHALPRLRTLSTGDPWPTQSTVEGPTDAGLGILMVDGYAVPVALEDQASTAMYEDIDGDDDDGRGGLSYEATAVYEKLKPLPRRHWVELRALVGVLHRSPRNRAPTLPPSAFALESAALLAWCCR